MKSPQDEYYLLGGAILVDELTEDAIRREIFEEVGLDIEIGALAFIIENQFVVKKSAIIKLNLTTCLLLYLLLI